MSSFAFLLAPAVVPSLSVMDEDRFWTLVAELAGNADDRGCHRLYLALRREEPEDVLAFQDRLREVLFRLDLRSLAKQRWRDVSQPRWSPRLPLVSADGFLYARCAVVAAGHETFEAVLGDHRTFRGAWDLGAERLLYVAEEAYEGSAGRSWPDERAVQYDDETGANPTGGW